jgi:hypothetical protein
MAEDIQMKKQVLRAGERFPAPVRRVSYDATDSMNSTDSTDSIDSRVDPQDRSGVWFAAGG